MQIQRLDRSPDPVRLLFDQPSVANRIDRFCRHQFEAVGGLELGHRDDQRLHADIGLALAQCEKQALKGSPVDRGLLAIDGIVVVGMRS